MIARAKGYKGKCDVLFSKIIRSEGRCLRCGSIETLQTSHIISRTYSATRTDLANAQCLCAKCHFYFTNWPREFSKWITESVGSEVYDSLKAKAEAVTKINWQEEYERLKVIAATKDIKV